MVSTVDGHTREEADAYALESQKRAANAHDNGYFDRSVMPVKDIDGITILERDDFIKSDTTEKLVGLSPSFEAFGSMGMDEHILMRFPQAECVRHIHTPGNSSGIVDGASAVLIGSEQAGKDLGLAPRGRIAAGAVTATDPTLMFLGPAPATRKCLKIADLDTDDIDLWELNEAFASAVLRYMDDIELDHEQINVNWRGYRHSDLHRFGRTRTTRCQAGDDRHLCRRWHRNSHPCRAPLRPNHPFQRIKFNELVHLLHLHQSCGRRRHDHHGHDRSGQLDEPRVHHHHGRHHGSAGTRKRSQRGRLCLRQKDVFCRADLNLLIQAQPDDAPRLFDGALHFKSLLRRLEKLPVPVPVVAVINGAVFGAGYELGLACNHRIVWDDKSVEIGLPEVRLGLLLGGDVVRLVHTLELQSALPFLLEGKKMPAACAVDAGLVHESVATLDELLPRATTWILQNNAADAHVQPWDRKGHKIPGGNMMRPSVARVAAVAPHMLMDKTRGNFPAPNEF